jgi:hypothetical protein
VPTPNIMGCKQSSEWTLTSFSLRSNQKAVQVGDGMYANVVGACQVPLQIGACEGFVTSLVLDQFSKEFDLVLGNLG